MKIRNIFLISLITIFFAGCNIDHYHDREERIVSKILQSQQTIYRAGADQTTNLLSDQILYSDNYYYDSSTNDGILSLDLHVGDMTLAGYGYDRFTMSNVLLDYDLDTITRDYAYDYSGYMYDDYQRFHFTTTKSFAGYADSSPHKGIMQIIGDEETYIVNVIDNVRVNISVYDHYDSYYDRTIYTTWHSLGF